MSDEELSEHAAQALEDYRAACEGLVAELQAAGAEVSDIRELDESPPNPEQALEIIARWIPRIDYEPAKLQLAIMLRSKWAKKRGRKILVREISRLAALDPRTRCLWELGDSLERIADDDIADELIPLALNKALGRSREMLIVALGRCKKRRPVAELIEVLREPEFCGYAAMALAKLKPVEAREQLSALAEHDVPWIRKEAQKALRRIPE